MKIFASMEFVAGAFVLEMVATNPDWEQFIDPQQMGEEIHQWLLIHCPEHRDDPEFA